jgi:TPR repeat protein
MRETSRCRLAKMKAASEGAKGPTEGATPGWLEELAKVNRFLAKLKVAEAKGDAAHAASWEDQVMEVASDPKAADERRQAAGEALVMALAHGTPLIARDTIRALMTALANHDGWCHGLGRRAVQADQKAAAKVAFELAETMPQDLVFLGEFFSGCDSVTAGKLFAMAMQRPELRFEALVAYGFHMDPEGSDKRKVDHKRAFRAFREACDMFEKDKAEKERTAPEMLRRLAEMYEKGQGTAKNPQLALLVATLAVNC